MLKCLLGIGNYSTFDLVIAITGIVVVFAVLYILVLYVNLQNLLFSDKSQRKQLREERKKQKEIERAERNRLAEEKKLKSQSNTVKPMESSLDEEIAVAISVAIACYLEGEVKAMKRTETGFVVKKIRKI